MCQVRGGDTGEPPPAGGEGHAHVEAVHHHEAAGGEPGRQRGGQQDDHSGPPRGPPGHHGQLRPPGGDTWLAQQVSRQSEVAWSSTIFLFRLEELRRLNYSLDVELQRERTDRIKLEQKVMSPRSVQAARMLSQSDGSER